MSQLCCRVPFLVDSGDLELLDENVHITDAIVDTTLINAFCHFTVDTNVKRVTMGNRQEVLSKDLTNFFIELKFKMVLISKCFK